MNINVDLFLETLPMMAKGMAGIFIVVGVIYLATILIRKLTTKDN